MIPIQRIQSKYTSIHAWFAMAIAFCIPTMKKLVPLILAVFLVFAVTWFIRHRARFRMKPNATMNWMMAIYLLHLVGLFWTDDLVHGLKELEIKLSFAFFPLLYFITPGFSKTEIERILRSFMWGCLVFIPVAILFGLYRWQQSGDIGFMSYEMLGINYHPTYAATYQAFTLFFLMRTWGKGRYVLSSRVFHLSALVLCILFICMLTSKAGLLSAGLCIVGGSIAMIKRGSTITQGIGFAAMAIGLLALFTFTLPAASERIQTAVWEIKDQQHQAQTHQATQAVSSTQLRMVTWNASWQFMQQHPFGSGTGEAQQSLNAAYAMDGESYAAEHRLNAHNQWLQYGVELGWMGLLLFLGVLASAWRMSVKRKTHWYTLILLLLCMNMLFESMLEVQAGITFFSFFTWVVANKGKMEEV